VISIEDAVRIVVYLLVAGIIFGLLWWLVQYINPPDPFKKVANVVLAILAVLVVIGALLSFIGHPIFISR